MRAGLGLLVLAVASCNGGDIVLGAAGDYKVDAGDSGMFVPPPCWPCSADLQSVVGCDGRVIKQCPTGQACRPYPQDGGPARCEAAPCTSAAENFTTTGCDFFLLEPDASPPGAPTANSGACWAVLVANAWTDPIAMWFEEGNDPTSIDAAPNAYIPQRTTGGIIYTPLSLYDDMLPPNKMAVVFIASDVGNPQCPPTVSPRFSTGDFALHETGRRNALRLRTSLPVTAVDVYPYGGSIAAVPGASALLPTSSWGNSTLGATAWPVANGTSFSGLAIVSLGSTVSILPPVAIAGGLGVAFGQKNQTTRYTIDPASILQFEQPEDLTGSLMTLGSGAQFSVWGFHKCMSIPSGSCDGAHVELPPTQALGSKFAAARFASRSLGEESVPWRFAALSDGTVLQFDPPMHAPIVLSAGQWATIDAPGPFLVSSQDLQHPIYVTEHMTRSPTAVPEGDPETVPVIPIEQWLTSYTFAVEPTYRNTRLVVVQGKVDGTFQDVVLDCIAGPIDPLQWQPIGTDGNYRLAYVEIQNGGDAVGLCDFGAHVIASRGPMSVTVWSTDDSASIGYPAGSGIRRINSVNVTTTPK